MKESILHYVWQYKLFNNIHLSTIDGVAVEIIDAGRPNTDAGPDFFNAKIRIDGTLWAGNVEIHTLSSDWKKHSHQNNKAYDNVILHVVKKADETVFRTNGQPIPQLELKYPSYIDDNYEQLLTEKKWVACENKLCEVSEITIRQWKTTLLTQRLMQKTDAIKTLLKNSQQHWEEAFYISLARSFGFGINSQIFEALARSLPLNILAKHKNNLFQIEALLLGQAGFLDNIPDDDYALNLKKEYAFLQKKFGLQPLSVAQWKMLRIRPDNFPTIRIAQFAALIYKSSKLFSRIIELPEKNAIQKLFSCQPSEYWKTHYLFGHESPEKEHKLGKSSINSILINTIVPFLFCYGELKGIEALKEKAVSLLEEIPAEKNAVITGWKNLSLEVESAYDSQALLQLKKQYCDEKKCLRCPIGHKVLTMK